MKNKALFTSQKVSWSISRMQCSPPFNQVDKLVGKETLKSWLSLQQINCHAERAQPNSHVSCCYVHEMSAAEAMEATAHARCDPTVKCYTFFNSAWLRISVLETADYSQSENKHQLLRATWYAWRHFHLSAYKQGIITHVRYRYTYVRGRCG